MNKKLLEECEVGDWVTFSSLHHEGWPEGFEGELTLPDGEVRRFQDVQIPSENGTDYAWKRVA